MWHPSNEGHELRWRGAATPGNIRLRRNSFLALQGFGHVLDTALQRIKGRTWRVLSLRNSSTEEDAAPRRDRLEKARGNSKILKTARKVGVCV